MPELELDFQQESSQPNIPSYEQFAEWVIQAVGDRRDAVELSLRIVDEQEGATLNETFRPGKKGATNVLSFPPQLPPGVELPFIGDIVICAPVVAREAHEQQKTLAHHYAHLTIHGTLHLLGYDHETDSDAEIMESLETEIMQSLDLPDPYSQEKGSL